MSLAEAQRREPPRRHATTTNALPELRRRLQGHNPALHGVVLPWVQRLAAALLRGERIGLSERDRDEALAILRTAIALMTRNATAPNGLEEAGGERKRRQSTAAEPPPAADPQMTMTMLMTPIDGGRA
jgi:hypothetical protein